MNSSNTKLKDEASFASTIKSTVSIQEHVIKEFLRTYTQTQVTVQQSSEKEF